MPAKGFYRYEYRHNIEKLEKNWLPEATQEERCALGAGLTALEGRLRRRLEGRGCAT